MRSPKAPDLGLCEVLFFDRPDAPFLGLCEVLFFNRPDAPFLGLCMAVRDCMLQGAFEKATYSRAHRTLRAQERGHDAHAQQLAPFAFQSSPVFAFRTKGRGCRDGDAVQRRSRSLRYPAAR